MLNNVITTSEVYGLTLNAKNVIIIVTKTEVRNKHLYVEDELLERVVWYDYHKC